MKTINAGWAKSIPYVRAFVRAVQRTAAEKLVEGVADPYRAAVEAELQDLEQWVAYLKGGPKPSPREVPVEPLVMPLGQLLYNTRCKSEMFQRNKVLNGFTRDVVYVVRDGDVVLYVGSTRKGARKRLKAHISSRSLLGSAIQRKPESFSWSVEMLAMPDKRTALQKEQELARRYRPKYCLKT